MESHTPLDFYAGPLVWVDCEMTGLDARRDKILEIAVCVCLPSGPSVHPALFNTTLASGYYH